MEQHSALYSMIKNFYDLGLYKADDLDLFVSVGYITADEKQEIITPKVEEQPTEPVEETAK